MKKNLPIFDIIVNEEDLSQGVGRISLVDEPAIGVDWITLRKQPKMIMAKKAPKSVLAKRECLGCPPNGDGTTVKGEPDRRCKGDGSGKEGGGSKGVSKGSGGQTNNIPKSASSYDEMPDSEMAKTIDKNSLPEPTNAHEKYLNNLINDPDSIYYDGEPVNTLSDAIFTYQYLTGPNGNENAAVNWAKKVKFK